MLKKIALLLALVLMVSVLFVACDKTPADDNNDDQQQGDQSGDEGNGENENGGETSADVPSEMDGIALQDTTYDEDDYYYNPKITQAYKVDSDTVRIKFDIRVYSPSYTVTDYIYAASTVFNDVKIKAKDMKILDPKVIGAKNPELYGMTFDINFESAIPEDGYICFVENDEASDRDGSLDLVLCDNMSAGIYAGYRPANDADGYPVAAARYTDDIIEEPEMPTVLLRAYYENQDQAAFMFQFSKPVTFIDGTPGVMGYSYDKVFICDSSDPNPGYNGSWQNLIIGDAMAINPIIGDDGLLYSDTWEAVFNGNKIPTEGVLRISENGTYADANNDEDDATLGRVVVAIDGTPLEASSESTWDVAHCKYTTHESAYIPGGMYDPALWQ